MSHKTTPTLTDFVLVFVGLLILAPFVFLWHSLGGVLS